MEYTLYLVSENGLSKDEQHLLLEEAKSFAGQNIEGVFSTTSEIRYENRQTGVYFQIYYAAAGQNDAAGVKLIPDDYYDTGLAFKIPYFKGIFFAYEAIWRLVNLCNNYNLLVLNPHTTPEDEPPEPMEVNFDDLVENYKDLNAKVSQELIKEERFQEIYYYLSEKEALQWWNFMFHKDYLVEQYQSGEGIFVPTLMLVNKPGTREVYRALIMKTGLTTLFPDADLVMVMDEEGNAKAWKTEAFIKKGPSPVKQLEFQNRTYTCVKLDYAPKEGDKNKPVGEFDDYNIIPASSVHTEDLREMIS